MQIVLVGLSHKTAPLSLRERVHFPAEEQESALKQLLELFGIQEGMILSTCNRVELLAVCDAPHKIENTLRHFFSQYHKVSFETYERYLYIYRGEDAVRHLFRVASSLDAMVIGEPQILGQVKDAYYHATHAHTTGTILHRCLHRAFNTAKRVRTETGIGDSSVSVSSAAVDLAEKIFGSVENRKALVLGAGEMSELTVQHLLDAGISSVLIANRDPGKAEELAAKWQGAAVPFERFSDHLPEVDIIISCTGSPAPIISRNHVLQALKQRKQKPLFFIDIAVPRDIDPEVHKIDNAYLYNIDDLQGVVETNLQERRREAKDAEEIITRETRAFLQWLEQLDVVPTIVSLREKAEEIRLQELKKGLEKVRELSEEDRQVCDAMTTAIVNKILHLPLQSLKQSDKTEEKNLFINTVRRLFSLDEEEKQEH